MPTNEMQNINAGWDLFKQALRVFRKHPAFLVPIFIVWCLYAPTVIYSKYFLPWHLMSQMGILLVVFLELFWFSLIILAACTVMLEMIRQMEFGQELSVTRAMERLFEKDILKIIPLAVVWAALWFILTVVQAMLSRNKNQNSSRSDFNLENTAKTLAGYQTFSWTSLGFEALQKGIRMIVFLILPAIIWERLSFNNAVRKGFVVLKTEITGFAVGYGLTYATAFLVFLPALVVCEFGTPHKNVPPLFHYPPVVWLALILYIGLAWSFCMYLEQMFMASLYYWQMNWQETFYLSKQHGEYIPAAHQVPIPELLGLPDITSEPDVDLMAVGEKQYAASDYEAAYQTFTKVLLRDSKNTEALKYFRMTVLRLSNLPPN